MSAGFSSVFLSGVNELKINLDVKSVREGVFQTGTLQNSRIGGKIISCTYRAMSLVNMTDVEFDRLEIGEVTGGQNSVVISYSGTRANVLFNRCKFRKGANTVGALDIGGTNTNVTFVDCDLLEWGTEINKMIKNGSSGIKRERCLGMNYLNAPPTSASWNVGEIVWNSEPAPGEYLGWICTTAGSLGTMVWKGFGLIQA